MQPFRCGGWLCLFSYDTHGHAAIDDKVLSGDEIIFDQLKYCVGYLLWRAFTIERNPVLMLFSTCAEVRWS